MKTALIDLPYLPPIGWFSAVAGCDGIHVEKFEHYVKQTYRNRCYINAVGGKEALVIPVTAKHGKPTTGEVRIDYNQKWLNNHWRAIRSAYGKAPFFEYYADELHDELYKKHELLFDLNRALLTLCLKWLKWKTPITVTTSYVSAPKEGITDLRNAITPKKGDMVRSFYQPAVYYQVFGSKFVENLSLIDVVFCEGPGASAIVRASTRQ